MQEQGTIVIALAIEVKDGKIKLRGQRENINVFSLVVSNEVVLAFAGDNQYIPVEGKSVEWVSPTVSETNRMLNKTVSQFVRSHRTLSWEDALKQARRLEEAAQGHIQNARMRNAHSIGGQNYAFQA